MSQKFTNIHYGLSGVHFHHRRVPGVSITWASTHFRQPTFSSHICSNCISCKSYHYRCLHRHMAVSIMTDSSAVSGRRRRRHCHHPNNRKHKVCHRILIDILVLRLTVSQYLEQPCTLLPDNMSASCGHSVQFAVMQEPRNRCQFSLEVMHIADGVCTEEGTTTVVLTVGRNIQRATDVTGRVKVCFHNWKIKLNFR